MLERAQNGEWIKSTFGSQSAARPIRHIAWVWGKPGEGKEYVGPLSCPDVEFAEVVEPSGLRRAPAPLRAVVRAFVGVTRRHGLPSLNRPVNR